MHFYISCFLCETSKFSFKLHTEIATITGLLTYEEFGSNFVLLEQKLRNSIISQTKNGGLKPWSYTLIYHAFYAFVNVVLPFLS